MKIFGRNIYRTVVILTLTFLFITTIFNSSSEARRRRVAQVQEQRNDLSFKVEDNEVVALKEEKKIERWYPRITYEITQKELWRISFPSIKDKKMLLGPTKEINGKIYFAYSSYVMELDIQKAQFVDRYQLLGEITSIDVEEKRLVIKTFNGIRGKFWDKEPTIRVTPEQLRVVSTLGTITNRDYENLYLKRKDAENLSESVGKVYIKSLVYNKYPFEKLELLKQEYLKATEADTTNPWYYIYLALINNSLDKKIYADIYFKKALDTPGMAFYDYFQLSTFYEYIEKRRLADTAFDRGITDFLARGYTPEQLTSIQSVLNYSTWLIPAINKLKDKDVERTLIVIDRFYTLSPFKEGNYNILSGVVKYLTNNGKLLEAKEWQVRADNSRGFFFPGDYSVIMADIALNIFLASILSFIVFFILSMINDINLFYHDKKHKKVELKFLFKRRYISKTTIYSFLVLYLFSLITLGLCSNTLGSISKMIKEPPTINSGTWGNYATVKYFDKGLGRVPERNLFLGIAYQQLKDFSTAIDFYSTMDTPESHNNLATIYIRQGKKQSAIEELNKALSLKSYMVEAKYNLYLMDKTKPIPRTSRVDLYQKYNPNAPMIALPEEKYYRKAFYSGLKVQDFNPFNIVMFNKFLRDSDNTLIEVTKLIVPLFLLITFGLCLILASVFIPHTRVTSANPIYLRRVVGIFIPGISYNWKLLGPLVFSLWLGLGITIFFYFGLSFESIRPTLGLLTTYALPDYSNLSPVSSFDLPFSKEIGFVCAFLFIVIWLYNFCYVLISKRFVSN